MRLAGEGNSNGAGDARRIIFLNRFFYPDHSATSQILSDLAFALASRGRDVGVIASRLRYDDPRNLLPAEEVVGGVNISRVKSTSFGRHSTLGRSIDYGSFLLAARARLALQATQGSIVVAKTDPPMLGAFVKGVALRRGAKLVNWIQDLFPEIAAQAGVPFAFGPAGRALRRFRDGALSDAAATVVVGERMAEKLRSIGAPRQGTVHVIHNWADGTAIRPMDTLRSPVRDAYGLRGRFVVGYSGNFGRVHEFSTLLRAAAVLKADDNIRFLFIGGGRQLATIRDAVNEQQLDNVVLAPYQPRERLGESLAASDVHLCTLDPRFEGLVVPSKIYGIMAAGRPCIFIGDPDGEIARVINRGRCGMNIPAGDVDGLVEAIRRLSESTRSGLEMGVAARALFDAEFDMPIAISKWECLIRSLG
jgi:colanic acid biosynthesis glycosyl transferase WcaI